MERKHKRILIPCACGCGELLLNWNGHAWRKYVSGHHQQFIKHPSYFGKESSGWKDGKRKHGDGYIEILKPDHPFGHGRYVYEHRLVMEKHLGRYLQPNELVHHINGIKHDNRIENLEIFTRPEHARHHGKEHFKNGMSLFGKINVTNH